MAVIVVIVIVVTKNDRDVTRTPNERQINAREGRQSLRSIEALL